MTDAQDPPSFELVDADEFDVSQVDERFCNLEQLERSRARWRQAALACAVLAALLICLSGVQISGTVASIKLVHETRDEMDRVKAEMAEQVRQVKETQEQSQKTQQQLQKTQEQLTKVAGALMEEDHQRRIQHLELLERELKDKEMELRRRVDELRSQNPKIFAPKSAGHEPDKGCPAGLKHVADDD